MSKYTTDRYKTSYFRGGSNIHFKLIMCEGKTVIPLIIQSSVLHWHNTYLLHIVIDRTEAMILQHFYSRGIVSSIHKEVRNCGDCQHTKQSNKICGKSPSKVSE